MRKTLSILLALAMVLGMSAFAFADATTTTVGGNATSQLVLDAQVAHFSVTVPTKLPVQLSDTGVVTVADDAKIINASSAQIQVTNIAVTPAAGWTHIAFTSEADFRTKPVNANQFALELGATAAGLEDSYTALTATGGIVGTAINGSTAGTEFPFVYAALVSPVSTAIGTYSATVNAGDTATGTAIADIVFTVGWVTAP